MKSKYRSKTSQVKVLLLAYGRTGSSLTGDLIAADTTSAYFFEPFWNRSSLTTTNSTEGILNGLFNCSPELISEITAVQWPHRWPYVSVRRPGRCQTSNLRVVKTIRVRKEDLEPWIRNSEIKVVHLVRDPRAVLSSRAVVGWEKETLQAARLCHQMLGDMALAKSLPPERYTLVRYEDLADNTEEIVKSLYARLGLHWTEEIRRSVISHTEASPSQDMKPGSTYRSASFSPESWKEKLSVEEVQAIEGECQEMMQRADYKMINRTNLFQKGRLRQASSFQ